MVSIPFSRLVSVYKFQCSSHKHSIIHWEAEITSLLLAHVMFNLTQAIPFISLEFLPPFSWMAQIPQTPVPSSPSLVSV